jgi:ribosome modulation factor
MKNEDKKLSDRTVIILWIVACIMFTLVMAKSVQDGANRNRQEKQRIYQDGFDAGAAGVKVECPYSTWNTDERVNWNRGYVAGAASRNTPRNAAD